MTDLKITVQRYDPLADPKPRLEEYAIPRREGMTVLDALLYVKHYVDHSVGIRYSCRQASCGSCGMKINGKPRLACYTQVDELGGERILAQPMDNFSIVRDLVTDLDSFFERHRGVVPRIVRADGREQDDPGSEYLMKPEELSRVLQFTYCIKCGLCTSSCPTVATDSKFPGPQALAQAYRYTADVRDQGGEERIALLDSTHGVWRCHLAGSCSYVCPKGVDPALGIQLLKRHVMSGRPPHRAGEASMPAKGGGQASAAAETV